MKFFEDFIFFLQLHIRCIVNITKFPTKYFKIISEFFHYFFEIPREFFIVLSWFLQQFSKITLKKSEKLFSIYFILVSPNFTRNYTKMFRKLFWTSFLIFLIISKNFSPIFFHNFPKYNLSFSWIFQNFSIYQISEYFFVIRRNVSRKLLQSFRKINSKLIQSLFIRKNWNLSKKFYKMISKYHKLFFLNFQKVIS